MSAFFLIKEIQSDVCCVPTSCYGLNKKNAVTNEFSPLDTSRIITVSAEHFLNRKENTIAKLVYSKQPSQKNTKLNKIL